MFLTQVYSISILTIIYTILSICNILKAIIYQISVPMVTLTSTTYMIPKGQPAQVCVPRTYSHVKRAKTYQSCSSRTKHRKMLHRKKLRKVIMDAPNPIETDYIYMVPEFKNHLLTCKIEALNSRQNFISMADSTLYGP